VRVELVADVAEALQCEAVFAGNWHSPVRWDIRGIQIRQIGALVPTGFDNPSDFSPQGVRKYGAVVIWEPGRGICSDEGCIPGPRFVTLSLKEAWCSMSEYVLDGSYEAGDLRDMKIFARVHGSVADQRECADALRKLIDLHVVQDGEVRVDSEAMAAAREDAYTEARGSSDFDSALAAYVEQMDVADGVDRDHVMSLAREYVSRGKSARDSLTVRG
jgi:hypothetical protein